MSFNYGTKNPVLIEARINHDPYDEFAWVQEWRFSIAQYLTDVDENVPRFRASFRGSEEIRDGYGYQAIFAMRASIDPGQLAYALRILDRYREWLHIAGKDY